LVGFIGQDAIGTADTVKETRLELKSDSPAANVPDEQTVQLKQQHSDLLTIIEVRNSPFVRVRLDHVAGRMISQTLIWP